jgi:hypothetical protein
LENSEAQVYLNVYVHPTIKGVVHIDSVELTNMLLLIMGSEIPMSASKFTTTVGEYFVDEKGNQITTINNEVDESGNLYLQTPLKNAQILIKIFTEFASN